MKRLGSLLVLTIVTVNTSAQTKQKFLVLSVDSVHCLHLAEEECRRKGMDLSVLNFVISDDGDRWIVVATDRIPKGLVMGNPGVGPSLEVDIAKKTFRVIDSHFMH